MRALLIALLALTWLGGAHAHPMPETRGWLDSRAGGAELTLDIPLNRLEFAFGQPLADDPAQVLARHGDALAAYLLQHVGARSARGSWQVLRPRLAVVGSGSAAELQATLQLRAPAGDDARRYTLLLDAVTHEVRTHRLQVLLRSDWAGGLAGGAPVPLGTLDTARRELAVDIGAERVGGGFLPLVAQGATHIAEGTDHLVFLLMLLIAAPLTVQAGRWGEARESRATARQVAGVVSAFTLGHSVTLAWGSSGLWTPPATAVEIAVALSIAVAAVHAWRPLWRGGELVLALGFGLVHGLAFSASLSGAGLGMAQHALALLAFNLGIELMQLLLVLLAMPPLVALARHAAPAYARLRRGAALLGLVLALSWLAQRAGLPWPVDTARVEAPAVVPACVALLWALWWWLRRQAGGGGRPGRAAGGATPV